MLLKAYAKINLTLELLSKREDGYHEVRSILQTVDLADVLSVDHALELTLEAEVPALQLEDNLVLRAARLLQRESGSSQGARLSLKKQIPITAGLGGGSSDAAATLVGLNALWGLGFDLERLSGIAAQLGSDVPFFIRGGTALVEGRGEMITSLPDPPEAWLVLACLPFQMPEKTAELYKAVYPAMFTRGEYTRFLAAEIAGGQRVSPLNLRNAFEGLAYVTFPGLREFYQEFERAGAAGIRLSGAGPALFSMVEGPDQGRELLQRCDRRGLPAYLVKTVPRYV